ncbi:MAG: hypothetical protein JW871_00730 [Endomicrobiales bacterium]|nr:hypothetical protein [Endomicrobiales bacterium]
MKIREMHITPIAAVDPPLLNAAGLHAPYALRIIIELITDGNVSGLSEIPGSEKIRKHLEESREEIIGKDPFNLTSIFRSLERKFAAIDTNQRGEQSWDQRILVHIFSAVEVACLDIIGKETGRGISDLLGGTVREQIPFSAYLFFKHKGAGGELGFDIDPSASGWAAARQAPALDVKGIIAQAKAMCEEFGFQSVKLKGGVFAPEVEVECLKALHNEFGNRIPLRFDPNGVWSVETAIRYGKEMEGILDYYEDPVRSQEAMSIVRKAVDIPVATNMCTTSFSDIPGSIRIGSEDIILSDHHFWGGLRASMHLERICSTFGRKLSMHSNSHLGISLAAMLHLGAVLSELPYAFDTHYPWQKEEVIKGGKFRFEDGFISVPKGPGLGVELDREALAELHNNYNRCGLTHRDDEIEMQKVEPGWKFELTRW